MIKLKETFSLIPSSIAEKLAITEIIHCNSITARYGLTLKESEAKELAYTRTESLSKVGRIEFSGGTINKLILAFCDSPYLSQFHYAETLHELIETFYYFKNESLDELDDDELIAYMKQAFDHTCQGSVDLLQTRELENLARKIRFGLRDFNDLSKDLEGVFEDDPTEEDDFSEDPFDPYQENSMEGWI